MLMNMKSSFARHEIVEAIADMAIAARSGSLLRAYQREWAWQDQYNFQDTVDANDFNDAFHGIESEFDKLALLLTQGGNPFPSPDWDSGDISMSADRPLVVLQHNLNSTDLLVDVRVALPLSLKESIVNVLTENEMPVFDPALEWIASNLFGVAYILPDPNHILLMPTGIRQAGGLFVAGEQVGVEIQARVWRY